MAENSEKIEIIAKYKITQDYYHQLWSDWLKHRRKWWKWFGGLGWLCVLYTIAFSIYLFYIEINFSFSEIVLLITTFTVGTILLFRYYYLDKAIWLRKVTKGTSLNEEHLIAFSADVIKMQASHSNAESTWDAVQDISITAKGLFLVMQGGMSIFIPDDAFDIENAKEKVLGLFETSKSNILS